MKQKQSLRAIQAQRYLRYSIRKFTVGVASVAIATGILMVGNPQVQAAEKPEVSTSLVETSSENKLLKLAETTSHEGSEKPVVDKTIEKKAAEDKSHDKDSRGGIVEKNHEEISDKSVTNTITEKIQTKKLEEQLSKVEARLAQLPDTKETKSAIDSAKELVTKAHELLKAEDKTQPKVDAMEKQLSSQLTILNSMKTEIDKEKKEHKNNDPRNGKAIPGKGESGLRAPETQSNNDVSIDGGKIIANGSISTEPRMGSYSGVNNISYNLKFKDNAYKQGDRFSITFEELGNGDSLPKQLSKDGKVFANLVKTEELYTQTYGKNGTQNKTPFWAQRDDSVSLEEKEAGHIQNRGTKTRFIYEFTSAIESLTDVTFKGSINNYSLRYPQISEDKEVTSKILVNDQPVVEKKYIMNKTNIEVDKESNAPSVLSTTGSMDISENGELLSHNEEFRLASNKYEYDTGTTIKIKLKNKNLNKFAKIGDFKPAKANVQNNITTANSKVNENGVILKEPRGDVYFQVTNLTEDEVTIKIVKGKASKGSQLGM